MNKKTNTTALENFLREATMYIKGKESTLSHIPKESLIFRTIATDVEVRKLLVQLSEEATTLAQVVQNLLDRTETED